MLLLESHSPWIAHVQCARGTYHKVVDGRSDVEQADDQAHWVPVLCHRALIAGDARLDTCICILFLAGFLQTAAWHSTAAQLLTSNANLLMNEHIMFVLVDGAGNLLNTALCVSLTKQAAIAVGTATMKSRS